MLFSWWGKKFEFDPKQAPSSYSAEDLKLKRGIANARYAVIFSATHRSGPDQEYRQSAQQLRALVENEEGFLGLRSVDSRGGEEITVTYWSDMESINTWKQHPDHLVAQERGRERWYQHYSVEVVEILRHYAFP